jgi:hypothetical protein
MSAQPARTSGIVSVFADVTRTGWWRAEGSVAPVSVFGDIELDLRRVQAFTIFGGVLVRS